jgi:hypothetical protein
VDSLREPLGIVTAGPNLLPLLANDRGRSGVLAEWQDAVRGNLGIAQHHERHHPVVLGGIGVVKNRRHLRQVRRPQGEVDRLESLVRQVGQTFRGDLHHFPALEIRGGDIVRGEKFVFGNVFGEWKRILVDERFFRHGNNVDSGDWVAHRRHDGNADEDIRPILSSGKRWNSRRMARGDEP